MQISGLLLALLLFAGCASSRQASLKQGAAPAGSAPSGAEVSARLDSLAALSQGDYIHLQVGPCFGKCDGYVSIFRESPAKYYIYEGEGWLYNEFDRDVVLYRLRKPVASDMAEEIFRLAGEKGIMKLENDTTYLMTDQSFIWVRARIGGRTLAVDNAYLGGEKYAGLEGKEKLGDLYTALRILLFSYLFGKTPGN